MRILIVSLIFSSLLYFRCSEDNTLVSSSTSDSQLKTKILGTWTNEYITYTFDSNGNFQNTIQIIYSDINLNQNEIIRGTYNINNNVLSFDISEWKNFISDSTDQFFTFSSIPSYKINIVDDLIYFYPVDILTSITDDNGDIWGEWYSYQWARKIDSDNPDSVIFGKLEWTYNFNRDSKTITYGSKFEADFREKVYFTDTLEYNYPDLKWGTSYNKTIEFHDGQLYLFEKLSKPLLPLTRIE